MSQALTSLSNTALHQYTIFTAIRIYSCELHLGHMDRQTEFTNTFQRNWKVLKFGVRKFNIFENECSYLV